MKKIIVPEDAGCFVCGRKFTKGTPSTHMIPMRNEPRAVQLDFPAHAHCARAVDAGRIPDELVVRVNHYIDEHAS